MYYIEIITIVFLFIPTRVFPQGSKLYTEIQIPVRDSQSLAADLYANHQSIAKPVILIQTPYNKNSYRLVIPHLGVMQPFPYDSSRYNYVIVDWRGFYASSSAAVAGYDRGLDGYDVVEWIALQAWCNGKIGTWGPSALGQIQYLTAKHQPPHLMCAVPIVRDFQTKYSDYYYGGALRKEHIETLERLGFLTVQAITSHPSYTPFWKALEALNAYEDRFTIPMLLIGGWFDHYPDDVLRAFDDLRNNSAPQVRNQHKLVFGPWLHSEVDQATQAELTYPNAENIGNDLALRFFDYYLNGAKNGYPLEPVMKYYQMGENVWRDIDNWRSRNVKTEKYYLHKGGKLRKERSEDSESFSEIIYDPHNPSPSVGGARFNPFDSSVIPGPLDQRLLVESRNDVLIFSTQPFDDDYELSGPITVNLFLSSDRTDTDVTVRLCDVYPDGRSMIMMDGIKRMRFRDGVDKEVFMLPGNIYSASVELQNIALTLLKGHILRIIVGSADYPRFDRNLNNGGMLYSSGDTLVATNRFYHDKNYAASVDLTLTYKTTTVDADSELRDFDLYDIYPQPVQTTGILSFSVSKAAVVELSVNDIVGRSLVTLISGPLASGSYTSSIDVSRLIGGTYMAKLKVDGRVKVKPFILLK